MGAATAHRERDCTLTAGFQLVLMRHLGQQLHGINLYIERGCAGHCWPVAADRTEVLKVVFYTEC